MKDEHIIISERNRPYWQIPIASLIFTSAIGLLIFYLYKTDWKDDHLIDLGHNIKSVIYLFAFGVAFCYQKSVYIDTKKSKFRQTFEIGPIKLGEWKTITNLEYISLFHEPLTDGNKIYEINLWYEKNKHWELYEEYDYSEAFKIGFKLSEQLNIDFLDATVPNNYKWIDKKASKKSGKVKYFD